mmetsp:Transcript_21511/g.29944  ORF Transcript_21511/g.29944 Transcript_21511/m.29944 type:complete len:244 (-) Transcript_21511:123-854(-)
MSEKDTTEIKDDELVLVEVCGDGTEKPFELNPEAFPKERESRAVDPGTATIIAAVIGAGGLAIPAIGKWLGDDEMKEGDEVERCFAAIWKLDQPIVYIPNQAGWDTKPFHEKRVAIRGPFGERIIEFTIKAYRCTRWDVHADYGSNMTARMPNEGGNYWIPRIKYVLKLNRKVWHARIEEVSMDSSSMQCVNVGGRIKPNFRTTLKVKIRPQKTNKQRYFHMNCDFNGHDDVKVSYDSSIPGV